MAVLTSQTIPQTGIAPTLSAATSGGDQFLPSLNTVLLASNTSGSAITITVDVTADAFGQPVENVTVTVPAGEQVLFGPYDPGEVASSSTGLASMTYSSATGLYVAALTL
jgi:protocatechuate 3,4-dioxygenase beta subunit